MNSILKMFKKVKSFGEQSKQVKSFGGKSLTENLHNAELAIQSLSDDYRIHNHSNSQFAWRNFILSHRGGLRNIRQITAEINRKNLALNEVKHKYNHKCVQLQKLYEARKATLDKDLPIINADIVEIEDQIKLMIPPIEGAIKDIFILKNVYDQIMLYYENYTEDDFEREEKAYWIRRLFTQAICDIRERGTITRGNQEALDQIGLNVSHVEATLTNYLNHFERSTEDPSNKQFNEFLERCVTKYIEHVGNTSDYGYFCKDTLEDALFIR